MDSFDDYAVPPQGYQQVPPKSVDPLPLSVDEPDDPLAAHRAKANIDTDKSALEKAPAEISASSWQADKPDDWFAPSAVPPTSTANVVIPNTALLNESHPGFDKASTTSVPTAHGIADKFSDMVQSAEKQASDAANYVADETKAMRHKVKETISGVGDSIDRSIHRPGDWSTQTTIPTSSTSTVKIPEAVPVAQTHPILDSASTTSVHGSQPATRGIGDKFSDMIHSAEKQASDAANYVADEAKMVRHKVKETLSGVGNSIDRSLHPKTNPVLSNPPDASAVSSPGTTTYSKPRRRSVFESPSWSSPTMTSSSVPSLSSSASSTSSTSLPSSSSSSSSSLSSSSSSSSNPRWHMFSLETNAPPANAAAEGEKVIVAAEVEGPAAQRVLNQVDPSSSVGKAAAGGRADGKVIVAAEVEKPAAKRALDEVDPDMVFIPMSNE